MGAHALVWKSNYTRRRWLHGGAVGERKMEGGGTEGRKRKRHDCFSGESEGDLEKFNIILMERREESGQDDCRSKVKSTYA